MQEPERRRTETLGAPRAPSFRVRFRPEQRSLARNRKGEADQKQETPTEQETPAEYVEELGGVYIISVAARLLEMHPQTLRKYERLGLVRPFRTIGMLRLYSEEDIQKLRLIRHLEENLGLNLAGVELTLNLLGQLLDMRQRLNGMKEARQFVSIIEKEMAELFQRLNLPLDEQA